VIDGDAQALPVGVLRCSACGALDPGPRELCPACLRPALAPSEVPGTGRLVSWTVIRRAPSRFRAEAPYAVCVVDLDAGLRVTGRLADHATEPRPGDTVRAIGIAEGYATFESAGP
jgi:uncharacterized OB-fold protein